LLEETLDRREQASAFRTRTISLTSVAAVRAGTPGSVGVAVPQCRQKCASSGSGVWQDGQARAAVVIRYFCGEWTIFGAASANEYPVVGHFTAGLVGEKTPSGFVFHSQTCRS